MPLKLGVVGIDHGHIFGMLSHLLNAGCHCDQWWTDGSAVTMDKFRKLYPEMDEASDVRAVLNDPEIDLVLISAVPEDRADLAIQAMWAGKDVMVDKPGCTTLEQLNRIKAVQKETGRIWTVNFSERFQVPSVAMAEQLVDEGAIGRVLQTVNLAPHKQNLHSRPNWFFERKRFGGILCDIGCHQIDQFLHFTGSKDVQIAHASAGNLTRPEYPEFQDFGDINLVGDKGHGYIRVDWFTPDGLPTWGDGRLFLMGTEGTIEVRKYTDIGRPHKSDTLYLVNGSQNEAIDCADQNLPYFGRLIADVQDRTETAVSQEHTFRAMEIAIRAQMLAEGTA